MANTTEDACNVAYSTTVKKGHIRKSEYQLPDIHAPHIDYEMLKFEEPKRPANLKFNAHQTIIKVGELIKHEQTAMYKAEKEKLIRETKESIEGEYIKKIKIEIKKALRFAQQEHRKNMQQLDVKKEVHLQEELIKLEERQTLTYQTMLEDQKIKIENLNLDNIEQMKREWLLEKNSEIEIIISTERIKFEITERQINERLHGIHGEEMNKLREERRMAILKLKDTLVKEHKLHMMAVTKQCQDEYREELANKRDFYEQQMTVLRGRISEREVAVDDLREMISALADENKLLSSNLVSIRKAYYAFVKTTMPCDNASDFLFDSSFDKQ